MLDDRKAAILTAVVQEYIETAQPVGSTRVARAQGVRVSPATVRNEMVTLERDGYLVQPHTSAGRIPTDKGYRFFVDQITTPGGLPAVKKQQVKAFFAHAHGELEQMLHDTSTLLSSLTDCAALVIGPAHERATVRSLQLVELSAHAALAVTVLSNGVVEKRTIDLPAASAPERVAAAGAHLSGHIVGQPLGTLDRASPTGDDVTDDIVSRVMTALAGPHEDELDQMFVGGASRVAIAFEAVETVRNVLATLEEQYVIVTLLREVLDGDLSVSIGAEHGVAPLAECSLVVAPYAVAGEPVGTIGVLGPTRMNYPHAMAAVAVVSQRLGSRLSE